mgnify:CR=1 FL=1
MKRTLTEKQKKTLSLAAVVVFILLSLALAWFVGRPLIRFARQPEQFRAWVEGHGLWAPLAYAAMVFLQVVVAVIPGEPLEIAGGYAFGAWQGTALCLAGAVLGSVAVFALVRRWGRGLVEVFFPADKLEKLHFLLHASPKRTALLWLIFTVPGTPKDLLCYFAGLTDRHRGAAALHRHVHRGRQRAGRAELPGGHHCLCHRAGGGGGGVSHLPRRVPPARTERTS